MGKRSTHPGVETRGNQVKASTGFQGVEIHGKHIRIAFQWQGPGDERPRRYRETLKIRPTRANLKWASGFRQDLLAAIRNGTFDYATWFPDSKRAPISRQITFDELADLWLKLKRDQVQELTWNSYWSKLRYYRPVLGDKPVGGIRHSEVAAAVADIPWTSDKTRNNSLTPLRGVFELARRDGLRADNPAEGIPFNRHNTPEPDPFTLDEVHQILAHLKAHAPEAIWNYFQFAFFTGMRPSEIIALLWTDLDLQKCHVRVNKARTLGKIKPTKTYEKRNVELIEPALEALQRQRALTQLQAREIFLNPITGEPIINSDTPRNYWATALRKIGIRYRVAYQTRHTYATLNLMHGANPMWVARQLGHKNMQVTLKSYARWIEGADHSVERRKLEDSMGQNLGHKRGPQSTSEG